MRSASFQTFGAQLVVKLRHSVFTGLASSWAKAVLMKALNKTHREALAAIVQSGPVPAIHGVVRWRIVDLCQWLNMH